LRQNRGNHAFVLACGIYVFLELVFWNPSSRAHARDIIAPQKSPERFAPGCCRLLSVCDFETDFDAGKEKPPGRSPGALTPRVGTLAQK
jgi:hypothetical protein